ncbi:MAG: putative rane protein [Actinotalea sp.]|nr:putative rane protein [Actinotalea sp.]
MLVVAAVLAALAAAIHVYIFVLESVRWEEPATRRVFGTTPEQAATTRELAYNQGFYNLFLAVVTAVGLVLLALGHTGEGAALVLAGTGSMLLAALVLLTRSPDKRRAAVVQGAAPLLAVVCLAVALLA